MGKEIGIDLGTTNTIVSYVNQYGNPVIMTLPGSKQSIIPSVVYYTKRGRCLIGEDADRKGRKHPEACFRNFKTLLIENPKYKQKIIAENGDLMHLSAGQAMSAFLRELVRNIQDKIMNEFAGQPDLCTVENVIITIPAKYPSGAIDAIKDAAKDANLNNVALYPEPTAAALAYIESHENMDGKKILVYDFGGGTFDISLLENNGGVFSELYTDGLNNIGGNTLTQNIITDVMKRINDKYDLEMPDTPEKYTKHCELNFEDYKANYSAVFNVCNALKSSLSSEVPDDAVFEEEIMLITGERPGGEGKIKEPFLIKYTKKQLYTLIHDTVIQTIEKTKLAVQDADKRHRKIEGIILAGGSSQIALIQQELSKITSELTQNPLKIIASEDVSTLIARGAALMASKNFTAIEPISNCEIGIRKSSGAVIDAFKMIIPDNSNLPCEGSESVDIGVANGEIWIPIFSRDAKQYTASDITTRNLTLMQNVIISGLDKSVSEASVTLQLIYNKDLSLDVATEVYVNGQLIRKDAYKVKKESNLL